VLPETKELLKSMGKLIGYSTKNIATDFFNIITLGIPKTLLEEHDIHTENQVKEEMMQRQFPHLSSLPWECQPWNKLKIGESEEKVGMLLGRPWELDVIDLQEKRENNWECKFDKKWGYRPGAVYFKNKIVVAFMYCSTLNERIEVGFPIEKQIGAPVPQPTPLSPPCPYCGNPLTTPLAKQCFDCHMDWHNPNNVIKHNVTP